MIPGPKKQADFHGKDFFLGERKSGRRKGNTQNFIEQIIGAVK